MVSEERTRHCNKKTEGCFLASSPALSQRCAGDDPVSPTVPAPPSLLTTFPLASPLAWDLPNLYKKYSMKGVVYSPEERLDIAVAL